MADRPGTNPLGSIIFLVAIVAIGFLGYSIFKPKAPIVDDQTPESFIRSYSEFIAPYIPPSNTRPSFKNVETFLSYFDQESVDFFEDNFEELAYIRVGRDYSAADWKELGERSKRGEAVKYLSLQGPLSGGMIKEIVDEEGARRVVVQSRGQQYTVNLEETPSGYKFDQFMGQLGSLSGIVSTVQLPN